MQQAKWWKTTRFWIPMLAGLFIITLVFVIYQAFWIIPAANRSTFLSTIIVSIISFSSTLLVLWATTRQTRLIQQKAADDLRIQRDREDRKLRYEEMDDIMPLLANFVQRCAKYQAEMKQINPKDEPEAAEIAVMYYHIRLKIESHHINGSFVADQLETLYSQLGNPQIPLIEFHTMLMDFLRTFAKWAKEYKYND